ncbi:MAG: CCA tRNA nucleotidyltransferase [Pseudomonadota bacterium]
MTRITAAWLTGPAAHKVTKALEDAGHTALFVGGCVRNTLLNAPVTDLDLATDATPNAVLDLADATGIKAVPTGIDHGTVTLIHSETPIEVTTFRADVETDGRHAQVRFSTDVAEDARRRDFTMNALYCDARGTVVDPNGHGLADLAKRRVRFIGAAQDRVQEDYLRILRFFRFHAWYADPNGGLDADGLAACAGGIEGLAQISAERVGGEIKKLLAAPDPSVALGAMVQSGVLHAVLPGADDAAAARVAHLHDTPDAILRLAALGPEDGPVRLRLSRAESRRWESLRRAAADGQSARELGWRLGAEDARAALALRAALLGTPLPADMHVEVDAGAAAHFPVRSRDLMPDYQGAALGARLAELEAAWIASGLRATREVLLSQTRQ